MRAGVLRRRYFATRLSFRISRYGVTWTSLGITRWRPAAREGFPDMSRFASAPRGAVRQVLLTRQGISLEPYLVVITKRDTRPCIA